LPDRPFEYLFYVDFEIGDPETAEEALTELEAQAHEARLFGAYPAAAAPAD
jgi:prephenate dehydratase